jgi:hypothetical protein
MFGLVFEMSMNACLEENLNIGWIKAGCLLSGQYVETFGNKAKQKCV